MIAASLIAALTSFSIQSAQALTREEVKKELVELSELGYRQAGEDPHYPQQVQEAMARLHQKRLAEQADQSKTTKQSATEQAVASDYKADMPIFSLPTDQCVGPASFCNIYFGS